VNDKLQVVVDMLREHGFDTEARWIEQREHVAYYLTTAPADRNGECPARDCMGHDYGAHSPSCKVAAAWRALGDPRAEIDLNNAHDEAINDERWRQRQADPNYRAPTMTAINEFLRNAYSPERLDASVYANNPLSNLLPWTTSKK
jgi:hypothetical protein